MGRKTRFEKEAKGYMYFGNGLLTLEDCQFCSQESPGEAPVQMGTEKTNYSDSI